MRIRLNSKPKKRVLRAHSLIINFYYTLLSLRDFRDDIKVSHTYFLFDSFTRINAFRFLCVINVIMSFCTLKALDRHQYLLFTEVQTAMINIYN